MKLWQQEAGAHFVSNGSELHRCEFDCGVHPCHKCQQLRLQSLIRINNLSSCRNTLHSITSRPGFASCNMVQRVWLSNRIDAINKRDLLPLECLVLRRRLSRALELEIQCSHLAEASIAIGVKSLEDARDLRKLHISLTHLRAVFSSITLSFTCCTELVLKNSSTL